MRQPSLTRKARFRAALALAGLTAKEWAEQEGYSENHMYLFLR
jgi:DNA-binding CsgD family transcriptional regulator